MSKLSRTVKKPVTGAPEHYLFVVTGIVEDPGRTNSTDVEDAMRQANSQVVRITTANVVPADWNN